MNTIAKDISIGLSLDNENLSSPDVLVNRNAVLAVFKSAKQEGGAWIIPAGTGRVAVLAKKRPAAAACARSSPPKPLRRARPTRPWRTSTPERMPPGAKRTAAWS